jgi:hypothetical protein
MAFIAAYTKMQANMADEGETNLKTKFLKWVSLEMPHTFSLKFTSLKSLVIHAYILFIILTHHIDSLFGGCILVFPLLCLIYYYFCILYLDCLMCLSLHENSINEFDLD